MSEEELNQLQDEDCQTGRMAAQPEQCTQRQACAEDTPNSDKNDAHLSRIGGNIDAVKFSDILIPLRDRTCRHVGQWMQ